MSYRDLREFLRVLKQEGELKRITAPVDPILEIAEILVRCETIDREVPVNAEIILEGCVEGLPPEDGRDVLADEL